MNYPTGPANRGCMVGTSAHQHTQKGLWSHDELHLRFKANRWQSWRDQQHCCWREKRNQRNPSSRKSCRVENHKGGRDRHHAWKWRSHRQVPQHGVAPCHNRTAEGCQWCLLAPQEPQIRTAQASTTNPRMANPCGGFSFPSPAFPTQYRTPRQSIRHTHRIAQDAPRIDDLAQMGVESSVHEIVRCGSYCVCLIYGWKIHSSLVLTPADRKGMAGEFARLIMLWEWMSTMIRLIVVALIMLCGVGCASTGTSGSAEVTASLIDNKPAVSTSMRVNW